MTERGRRVRYVTGEPPLEVSEIIGLWSELQTHVPADQLTRSAEYLAKATGVALGHVHHLRVVRNACAHPASRGWPSADDVSLALGCATQLRVRLKSPVVATRPVTVERRPPAVETRRTPPVRSNATPSWPMIDLPYVIRTAAIALSPDGRCLASGYPNMDGGHDVTVRRPGPWTTSATFTGHRGLIHELAFSPDSGFLASVSEDRTLRIWPSRPSHVPILTGHRAGVRSVTFSPDGRVVASASKDGTTKIWSTRDWRELATLSLDGHWGLSTAFSPDGALLATGCGDSEVNVKVWNTRRWTEVTTLTGSCGWVNSVAFSPDGTLLAGGGDRSVVQIWNTRTWDRVTLLTGMRSGATSIAFSPDGHLLAAAFDADHAVKVWRTSDRGEVTTLTTGDVVFSMVFSPGGRLLATGGNRLCLFRVASV